MCKIPVSEPSPGGTRHVLDRDQQQWMKNKSYPFPTYARPQHALGKFSWSGAWIAMKWKKLEAIGLTPHKNKHPKPYKLTIVYVWLLWLSPVFPNSKNLIWTFQAITFWTSDRLRIMTQNNCLCTFLGRYQHYKLGSYSYRVKFSWLLIYRFNRHCEQLFMTHKKWKIVRIKALWHTPRKNPPENINKTV